MYQILQETPVYILSVYQNLQEKYSTCTTLGTIVGILDIFFLSKIEEIQSRDKLAKISTFQTTKLHAEIAKAIHPSK